MLFKMSDFEIDNINTCDRNGSIFIQYKDNPFELQTEFMTLSQYPLPGKKYLTDDSKSINLTIPINKGDASYTFLTSMDKSLKKLCKFVNNKKYHSLVREKDGEYYIKFKIYLNTALFDSNKNRISITSFHDFYKYLRQDKTVKFVLYVFQEMVHG